jgi:hypothetical protein
MASYFVLRQADFPKKIANGNNADSDAMINLTRWDPRTGEPSTASLERGFIMRNYTDRHLQDALQALLRTVQNTIHELIEQNQDATLMDIDMLFEEQLFHLQNHHKVLSIGYNWTYPPES